VTDEIWLEIKRTKPEEVKNRIGLDYLPDLKAFELTSFNQRFLIYPGEKKIESSDKLGDIFLKRFSYLLTPVFLNYLLRFKPDKSGSDFISYRSLRGGETYFRGSHQLPLFDLLGHFNSTLEKKENKLKKAAYKLDGLDFPLADLAYQFFPLPELPVVISFWKGEEELPSEANFLFPASAENCFPLDVLWAIAVYTCKALLLLIELNNI